MRGLTLQRRRGSGNALVVSVVSVAVLLLLATAVIRATGTSNEMARAKVAADRTQACAEAARRILLSRLASHGVQVTSLQLAQALPDSADPASRTQVLTGHYVDEPGAAVAPEATVVAISAASMASSRKQVRDLANALPASPVLGGQYYRVVVKCRQSDRREAELEFVFRHGI
ncbi:MAG: hypothetical protein ACOX6T_03725 [Myxococcales bacterium]|jgi:hypothetical protein